MGQNKDEAIAELRRHAILDAAARIDGADAAVLPHDEAAVPILARLAASIPEARI